MSKLNPWDADFYTQKPNTLEHADEEGEEIDTEDTEDTEEDDIYTYDDLGHIIGFKEQEDQDFFPDLRAEFGSDGEDEEEEEEEDE